MKKNILTKVISGFIGTAVTVGLNPVLVFAESQEQNNGVAIVQEQVVIPVNTSSTANADSSTVVDTNNSEVQEPQAQVDSDTTTTTVIELSNVSIDLSKFVATNSTTDADISNFIKEKIDSSISVKIENFKKSEASTELEGEVTGTAILSLDGNSKQVPFKLAIANLEKEVVAEKIVEDTKEPTPTTTTTAAVTTTLIDEPVIAPVQIVEADKVTSLKMNIGGKIEVGETITANVVGFNAKNEMKDLDPSKAEYIWYANGQIVGYQSTLKITDELQGKSIHFDIRYDEPKIEEGGIK